MNAVEQILVKNLKLSAEMYDQFMELSGTKQLKKKEFFVQKGKVCHHLGIVESGILRSYIEKDGEEYIKDFYFSGSIVVSFGSFQTGEPSIGYIQALEETNLVTLSHNAYFQLLNESAEWYKFGKYISDFFAARKCQRETSFLMKNAFERYKLLLKTHPHIEQRVPQHYIASYLGIKPETLCRIKIS